MLPGSTPTLFNSGTRHTQMSSCYLLDSPRDELDSIYDRYAQVARLSKFAGGIGVQWSRIRSRGALIRGTNGHSNAIVPWLRTLDASVAADRLARADLPGGGRAVGHGDPLVDGEPAAVLDRERPGACGDGGEKVLLPMQPINLPDAEPGEEQRREDGRDGRP